MSAAPHRRHRAGRGNFSPAPSYLVNPMQFP